jgi:hypothetical protein
MDQQTKKRMMSLPKFGPNTEQDAKKETKEKDCWKRLNSKALSIAKSSGSCSPKFDDKCEACRFVPS